MSSQSQNDLEVISTENLQLKTFKNKPKTSNETNNKNTSSTRHISLQSLISIDPEPVSPSIANSIVDEDGIIQPEPNFIPMINSLLENQNDNRNELNFMTDFDSVDGASTINRLFFSKDSSNILLTKLLRLRTIVNRINVSRVPKFYNTISYLHIIMFVFLTACNLLYFKYARAKLMSTSKILATVISNGLLNAVSDVIAQSITCFSSLNPGTLTARNSNSFNNNSSDMFTNNGDNRYQDDNLGLDLEDLEYQQSLLDNESIYLLDDMNNNNTNNSSDFQLWRLICFAIWGSFMANFQVPWYFILNKLFTEDPSIVQILERILSDQLFYSPISLYCFFAFANYVMDAGDVLSFRNKIKKIYLNTLMVNYLIWPAMQFINFSFINKDDQPLFSSCVSVVWNVVLSMRNASTK
ncbi:hypothetical protein ACO0SA_004742 [Hanseniaspora valbyensis]